MKWIALDGVKVRVVEISDGIAYFCREGNKVWLELNRHLKREPALLQLVLDHEKKHLRSNKIIDYWADFRDSLIPKPSIIKFVFRHPRVLYAYFPVRKFGGRWGVNWYLALNYAFMLGLLLWWVL